MNLRQNAYTRGYEDHGDGVTMCPYPWSSGLCDAWRAGWDDAAADEADAEAGEIEAEAEDA